MGRTRSQSRERGGREERSRGGDRDRDRSDRDGRRTHDRNDDKERSRRKRSRSPPRRHFREDAGKDGEDGRRDKRDNEKTDKTDKTDKPREETSEGVKLSKHEQRKAQAAVKRQKMEEEDRLRKDKVKDRLDLIRQMKGEASGDEDAMGNGSDGDEDSDKELTEEQQMMKLMGFAGFDSTKGKGVEDNNRGPAKGAISKHKAREYRQYMNRRGGFNRPLDAK